MAAREKSLSFGKKINVDPENQYHLTCLVKYHINQLKPLRGGGGERGTGV